MPREVIKPRLDTSRLTAQDSQGLLRSEARNCLTSRNAQVVFLADFAEIECGITLDTQDLADLFRVSRSRARRMLSKTCLTPKLPHRPPTSTLEQDEAAWQLIRNGASTGNVVLQRELLKFIETRFRKILTYGWVKSFLHRRAQNVNQVVVSPQELPQLQIPRRYLNEYIALIQKYLPIVPAELIFNLDETGLSNWEERKRKLVLIPAELD
jgi:hypothetical protein